jgi:XTP/dITP diphosphohydrolase
VGRVARAALASTNRNKLAELQAALPGWTVELAQAEAFPPEEGDSYYANALVKARYGRRLSGADVWVLGEDSGIEVAALGGEPGIHSARWSHRWLEDLLRRLEGVDDRRARYVCELVCVSPEGEEFRGTGTLEGVIADEARGHEGFGYDPVFVPEGESKTVAELGNAWKRLHSHRARAARALLAALGEPDPLRAAPHADTSARN